MDLATLLFATLVGFGAPSAAPPKPVVVELFTSEGCSSCPDADAVLLRLSRDQPVPGARIIALGFHVDYWDYIGWKDPFSARRFTDRQQDYARFLRLRSLYTPQMVVDGEAEFVGSRRDQAAEAVRAAAGREKLSLSLRRAGDQVVLTLPAQVPAGAEVFLALTEDNHVTQVLRGENARRTLAHAAVVREWMPLGAASPGKTWTWPAAKLGAPGVKRQAVALLQAPGPGRILGAETLALD